MPVVAAAGIGAAGSLLAANSASSANRRAANATQAAADRATEEQRRQYDQSRADQQPWLQTGTSALNQLASLYNLNGSSGSGGTQDWSSYVQNNPDILQAFNEGRLGDTSMAEAGRIHYQNGGQAEGRTAPAVTTAMDKFVASPDYQFRQDEQNRSLTARNAALGIQDSGAAQKAALKYSGNLASGEFNNYANRLSSLAGVGQTAANTTAQLGANYATQVGNIAQNTGAALSSSYQNQGAINSGLFQNLAGMGAGLANGYGTQWGGGSSGSGGWGGSSLPNSAFRW